MPHGVRAGAHKGTQVRTDSDDPASVARPSIWISYRLTLLNGRKRSVKDLSGCIDSCRFSSAAVLKKYVLRTGAPAAAGANAAAMLPGG